MAIGFHSYAIACGAEGLGAQALWESWLRGAPLEQERDAASAAWVARAVTCVDAVQVSRAGAGDKAGLILATTKGDMDAETDWMRGRDGAVATSSAALSPVPTLSNLTATLGRGLRSPRHVVSTACSSGLVALIDAAACILDGDADDMVVCGMDVAGSFVRDGFGALKAVSPAGVCRPFDRDRDGLMLGSGAAACRLSARSGAPVVLSGWGLASDAVHMTAPDREAGGLIRAMEAALHRAGLRVGDIDVLFAHGTGTRYNDAMEAVAIERVFRGGGGGGGGGGGAKGPAVTAVKGLIGHTLGASGVVEAILAARMIETQTVPAVTGLRNAETEEIDFVREARRLRVRHVMKVASGFGGLNAALILSAAPRAAET